MIQSLADTLILSWGWRRLAIGFGLGALAALSQAPVNAFPVLWLSFPALVWLLDGTLADGRGRLWPGLRAAAALGWWFGFGYFLAGLWWIGAAFLVEADDFAWMIPFAVLAMPAGLALLWALALAAARLLWSEGWTRVPVLAATLASAEWLRGHLFTGFPWNPLGAGLGANTVLMQPVALVGVYGLGFVAVLVFAAPAVLADSARRASLGFLLACAALFAACAGYGALRLAAPGPDDVADVRLRLVQPNIPQEEKWVAENRQWIFDRHLDLSRAPHGPDDTRLDRITHLIWPESAFPFLLTERADALTAIEAMLPEGTALITGAARAEPGAGGARDYYNSVYVIGGDGVILDVYDKVHLVPFGEYLPWDATLKGLGIENLTRIPGGFTAGYRRHDLTAPGVPAFSPLICYEIIFAGQVAARDARPGWLLNLTNDAWFGATPGPYQHLAQARLRAVEEGLPVVRAANTGISAVIDSRGRVRDRLPLGRAEVLDAALPGAGEPTLYVRLGDWPLLVFVVAALALAGTVRARRRPVIAPR